ncbi:MAG: NmrA family transcriptional regulator [Rubrobacteraceae bacterium]
MESLSVWAFNEGMTTNTQDNTTLVLGGTGKTGRRVAERLMARGVPVRIGSRSGEPPFDWEDRATWAPALDGVGSVYLSYYPDLAVPGAVEAAGSFAELAVRNGVPRLALLSGRGEPEAERAEETVTDSGAEVTILRSTWFMQNFSEDYMLEHVLSGGIRLPAGDAPTPFLDADDIADAAAAALTEEGHAGRLYELTGPRSLTFAEAAAEISSATGREVRYVPVSLEEHAAEAAEYGVPAEVVELLTYLFAEVVDGRNADTTDGIRRALGREPKDFADYAREAAATGVWDGGR